MHGNSTVHLSIFIMVIVWSYSLVNNFISLSLVFVALNIVIYGLMLRESTFSADATLKYFALGAAATASLFVGIFLHILAYGSAEYSTMGFLISRTLTCSILVNSLTWVHILAFILVLSSFLFKLGVYPYHFYLVDIYEGVRLESLVIITIPVKLATYFALLNFLDALGYLQVATQPLFVLIGLGSVLTGTYGAYLQNKLRCF